MDACTSSHTCIQKFKPLHNSTAHLASKTGPYEYITLLYLRNCIGFQWDIWQILRSSCLLIKPCMNWRHCISETWYRNIIQQGHWGPQDQTYCWHRRLGSRHLVTSYSTIQHPHYGISSQINWEIVIQSIVLNISIRLICLILHSLKFCNVYVMVHLVIFIQSTNLLFKATKNNTVKCGAI